MRQSIFKKSEKSIFVALPRLTLTGGNLMILKICYLLHNKGFQIKLISFFKTIDYSTHNAIQLIPRKKTIFNTILNLIAYLMISLRLLFVRGLTVSTHHLTSIFNFIRPTDFSFVQDYELDFWPLPLRWLGKLLWVNYLRSKRLIFTNSILAAKCGKQITDAGFIFDIEEFRDLIRSLEKSSKLYDVLFLLRHGKYKNPLGTLKLINKLAERGLHVAVVNYSSIILARIKAKENLVIWEGLTRRDFAQTMLRSRMFCCCSKWEGLGLPVIEAYLLGLKVMSTRIPSAILLSEFDDNGVRFFNSEDLSADEVEAFLRENQYSALSLNDRMNAVEKAFENWKQYFFNVFSFDRKYNNIL